MSSRNEDLSWKQRLDAHKAKLPDVEEAVRISSFDRGEYFKRIENGDDWQRLVQAHLYLEFIASKILEAELVHPNDINLKRMGFSARLDLISALGLVPQQFVAVVRKISKLRNKASHELNFEINEDEVISIRNTLPKHLRDVAEEPGQRIATGPLSLAELLSAIPLFFEMFRQQRAVWHARQKHHMEGGLITRGYIKHVLDTTGGN